MLKAILNDNVSRAIDLYVKQTGASPEKARVLVNKISDSVKEEYPAILHEEACEADMQAIKDVWPFGLKVFNMYSFAKNKKELSVSPMRLLLELKIGNIPQDKLLNTLVSLKNLMRSVFAKNLV